MHDLVTKAESLLNEHSTEYTFGTMNNLKAAFDEVNALYQTGDMTETEIAGATDKLKNAIDALAQGDKAVAGIALDKDALELYVSEDKKLNAKLFPADATIKDVTWNSSDPGVVEVAADGTVMAKKAGTAVITVTSVSDSVQKAECTVTVKVKETGVTLNKETLELEAGQKETLTATVLPADATDKAVTWTSGDPTVAEVDASGTVTAKTAGRALITATTANGVKATCTVTVAKMQEEQPAVSKIELSKKKLTLGVKEKFTLKTSISPKKAANSKVTWKLSKKGIVTVSSKGAVTAKKAGTVKVTAVAGGKKAVCTITVKKAPNKVSLNAAKKTLKRGKTFQIKVKLPANTASNKIKYSSSNSKVATVSASGKIKAVKKGSATITIKTFNGKKAKIKIKVN